MPHADRKISGLPCRFPATVLIFDYRCKQAYEYTGFFGIGEAPKKVFPGFPCAAGKGRGGVARSAQRVVMALGMPVFDNIAVEHSLRAA
jgi:hypothetical protein